MTVTLDRHLPTRPTKPRAKPSRAAGVAPIAAPATSVMADGAACRSAPLRLFELSDFNVRKTYDRPGIADLARDIAVRGMKQNLVAIPSPNGGGKLAVVAGGRRLRAWWHLVDEGGATMDQDIAYLLEDQSTARETSLAENVQKEALNPADEVEAFASVVDDHADDPDPVLRCATRFGKPRRYVERQLRLADLAVEILDALRAGRIDLDAAQAYATFGDHDAQLLVFNQEERRENGVRHSARNIRETMRGRTYPATIAQAVYVGVDAYIAAGGRVDRELLLGVDDGERLLDPAIADELARKKATAELPAACERDHLAEGVLTIGFSALPQWPRPPADFVHRRGVIPDQLEEALRATAIGVYTLAADGSALQLDGVMTAIAMPAPATPSPAGAQPAPAVPASPLAAAPLQTFRSAPAPREETASAAIARYRQENVRRRAAALAARAIAMPMLGDRMVVQEDGDAYDIETAPDGDVLVTIQVKVHPAELEAMRAEAEASIDADDDANDRVAAAKGEDDEEAGGGG